MASKAGKQFDRNIQDMERLLKIDADVNEPWFQDAVADRWRQGKKMIPDNWPRTDAWQRR